MHLPPHSSDTSLPEHWRHTPAQVESSTQGTPLQLKAWWKLFNEPELDRLVEQVAQSNLEVREMAARVAAAQALQLATSTEFRPSLRFASTPVETPDSRSAYLQSGLEGAWPLGLFGRAGTIAAASSADAQIARDQADSLRTRIIAETVRTYVEWRAASIAASNLDAQIDAQAERTDLMRDRVRLRLSGPADLAGEEAHLEELRSAHIAMERAIAADRERLGLLLATADAYSMPAAATDLSSIETLRVRTVPADLLRSRADVRQAEQEALRATADLNAAKLDLYPQLTLTGSLTLSVPITGTASGSAGALAAVAPAIDIPLFDWGRRRAIVTARDRQLEAALIAYRQCILAAAHEVEIALDSLDSLSEDAELRRRALRRAARLDESTATAVRLGRTSHLDALASTLAYLEAKAALASAEHGRALAYITLCAALGGADPSAGT